MIKNKLFIEDTDTFLTYNAIKLVSGSTLTISAGLTALARYIAGYRDGQTFNFKKGNVYYLSYDYSITAGDIEMIGWQNIGGTRYNKIFTSVSGRNTFYIKAKNLSTTAMSTVVISNVVLYDITYLYEYLKVRGVITTYLELSTWCDNNIEYHLFGELFNIFTRNVKNDCTKTPDHENYGGTITEVYKNSRYNFIIHTVNKYSPVLYLLPYTLTTEEDCGYSNFYYTVEFDFINTDINSITFQTKSSRYVLVYLYLEINGKEKDINSLELDSWSFKIDVPEYSTIHIKFKCKYVDTSIENSVSIHLNASLDDNLVTATGLAIIANIKRYKTIIDIPDLSKVCLNNNSFHCNLLETLTGLYSFPEYKSTKYKHFALNVTNPVTLLPLLFIKIYDYYGSSTSYTINVNTKLHQEGILYEKLYINTVAINHTTPTKSGSSSNAYKFYATYKYLGEEFTEDFLYLMIILGEGINNLAVEWGTYNISTKTFQNHQQMFSYGSYGRDNASIAFIPKSDLSETNLLACSIRNYLNDADLIYIGMVNDKDYWTSRLQSLLDYSGTFKQGLTRTEDITESDTETKTHINTKSITLY